jgi:HPt (histidine-containing phosphotransfer) domain-containing protein
LRDHSASEVEAAAHALKSSAAQLGAVRMQALCGRIEAQAAGGDLAHLPEVVDELETEFHAYERALPAAQAAG